VKAYTYYSHIQCLHDPELIAIWERSWRKHGWDTVILTEADAKASDPLMFDRFKNSPLLATRNPPEYTLAAMLRWIPMTRVTEHAIHLDWDVMCNGLRPEDVVIHDPVPTFMAGSTCPCAVAASPRGWKLFAAWLEAAPFMPAFSASALAADSCDQYATSLMPGDLCFVQQDTPCRLYKEQAGWESAPMIHFPNRLTPYPRSAAIKALGIV
jgi:hypothetical protein